MAPAVTGGKLRDTLRDTGVYHFHAGGFSVFKAYQAIGYGGDIERDGMMMF